MTHTITRRAALRLAGAGAALLAAPGVLRAQSFPSRPITMVVPFDTGGYNDRLGRAFAPFLAERLKQPVTVVNRGGAGAMLGHTFFLQQPDDGHTILCTSAAPFIPLNVLNQGASFKVEDFHMINTPSRDYTLMATAPGSKVKDIAQVVSMLKADSKSLSVGLQPASADLVNFMLFCDAQGIKRDGLRLVTFDGGGPARNAIAGGVVDIGLVGGEGFLPLRDKINPLLVFNNAPRDGWKAPLLTEVVGPNADFVLGSQRGFGVHATLLTKHPDRYKVIADAIEAVTKDPKVIEAFNAQQLATEWFGPEASNASLMQTAKVMATHLDLLKGT
jgi:tripartite-type tricarboxylate transporter receptor subunit TctC